MRELSAKLWRLIDDAEPKLRAITEAQSAEPFLSGGWSRKELIGHLIDSASNNHQRFVRAALQPTLEYPSYDQNANVRVQRFQEADWRLLISLWVAYNRHLAHVIANLPADQLETSCRIGAGQPVTLRFLATDYVDHLVHHLRQLGVPEAR